MFPRAIEQVSVIHGLRNSQKINNTIRRITGERGMFDTIDPETLQVVKYDRTRDGMNTIYSKNMKTYGGENEHTPDLNELNWNKNQQLQLESQKKESFKQRMTEIQNVENVVKTSPIINNVEENTHFGLLDKYLVNDAVKITSRRVTSKITSPTSTANNIDELYTKVLPELRGQLRKNGLRQVGLIRFDNSTTSDKLLSKLLTKTKGEHDAFHPMAFEDPSLRILAPKQWIGTLPSSAKDDIIQSAISGLKTDFYLSCNFVRQGEPIEFNFSAFQENQLLQSNALSSITLQLVITLTQTATSKTLLQTRKSYQFEDDSMSFTVLNESLNVDTKSMETGNYQIFSQVLLFLPNSSTSSILSSHGPFDVYLV